MPPTLQVKPATPSDISRLMDIVITSFADFPIERLMENTREHAAAMERRHLHAWAEHLSAGNAHPMGYKCVLSGPRGADGESAAGEAGATATETETIIASAEWVIYSHPRAEAAYSRPHYLNSGSWVVEAATRARIRGVLRPFLEARVRWMGGRPHALLLFMATDPDFRRRGAAKACVAYGVERCRELGIPAYLEATETGRPVYEAVGFEVVEQIESVSDDGVVMAFPAMVWWPEGYGVEERRQALPGFKLGDEW